MISYNFYNSEKTPLLSKDKNSSKNNRIKPFANHYVAKHTSYNHHMISEYLFFIQKRYNTTFKDVKKQQVIKKILKLKKKI